MLLEGYSYTARCGAVAVGALLCAAWVFAARRLPPGLLVSGAEKGGVR